MSSTTTRSLRTGRTIVRVQTGIRIERRVLKVLKGIAEYRILVPAHPACNLF